MISNIPKKNIVILIIIPALAIILGGIGFYFVEVHVDEPSITNVEDAFWLALVTITTVGYGEVYPKTTEGRIIATLLLFVGVLTLFGFLSAIAFKIVHPTQIVNSNQNSESFKIQNSNSKLNIYDKEVTKTENPDKRKGKQETEIDAYDPTQSYETKLLLKEKIDKLEEMSPREFANFILKLTNFYYDRNL